jgi:long-subunit acyl-CoA synthetase (AMP-forming)
MADSAMLQVGIVPVPIHSTARLDEVIHISKDAALRACFVSDDEMLAKIETTGVALEFVFSLKTANQKRKMFRH